MTRRVTDLADWSGWLDRRPGVAHVLVDEQLIDGAFTAELLATLSRAGRTVLTYRRQPDADVDELASLGAQIAASWPGRSDLLVAVGGGGVVDQAKLLRLLISDPRVGRRLANRQRCGFITLSSAVAARGALAVVPTTLGTGAELSRSACVRAGAAKRLAFGEPLRADLALVTPAATASLPLALVAEGIVEALLRLLSPYVGSLDDRPTQDDAVERYAIQLLQAGDLVRKVRDLGGSVPPGLLAEVAAISGNSHSVDLIADRDPCCDVCWPLANEISMLTGLRKLTALAAITPVVWRRVLDGDGRLGSARRLRRVWSAVVSGASAAPSVAPPDVGLTALLERWGIEPMVRGDVPTPEAAARRAAKAWGNGLPMLRGLSVEEITAVYADALAPTAVPVRRLVMREEGNRCSTR